MFEKDRMDLDTLRTLLHKDAKVLNITHNDMDGIGCHIVLSNCVSNCVHRKVSYPTIDDTLKEVDFSEYDCVFVSDIAPEGEEDILSLSKKIVLVDHHPTALRHHNPEKNRFVYKGKSATALMLDFCEIIFEQNLSHLKELVFHINDYDMWIHESPVSKELNIIYYMYWDDKFKRRFFDGFSGFNKEEKDYIRKRDQAFATTYHELEVFDLEHINGCLTSCDEFVNDVCEKLLDEEGYKIIFVRNPHSKNVSVRSRIKNCNIGEVLKSHGIGGGHDQAGGMHAPNIEEFKQNLNTIETTLYEQYEDSRR